MNKTVFIWLILGLSLIGIGIVNNLKAKTNLPTPLQTVEPPVASSPDSVRVQSVDANQLQETVVPESVQKNDMKKDSKSEDLKPVYPSGEGSILVR